MLQASLLFPSSVGVPVIRVKPAENHSAKVLTESTVGFSTILPWLARCESGGNPLPLLDWERLPFVETVLSCAGPVGDGELSLEHVFLHF
jgi:hypothetical protein